MWRKFTREVCVPSPCISSYFHRYKTYHTNHNLSVFQSHYFKLFRSRQIRYNTLDEHVFTAEPTTVVHWRFWCTVASFWTSVADASPGVALPTSYAFSDCLRADLVTFRGSFLRFMEIIVKSRRKKWKGLRFQARLLFTVNLSSCDQALWFCRYVVTFFY